MSRTLSSEVKAVSVSITQERSENNHYAAWLKESLGYRNLVRIARVILVFRLLPTQSAKVSTSFGIEVAMS